MQQLDLPPLAQYKALEQYRPAYGDYVVWSGWVTTWHGIVTNYNQETDTIQIVFSGLPRLLFTMTEKEIEKETKKLKLSNIKSSPHGKFSILQQDQTAQKANVWYL